MKSLFIILLLCSIMASCSDDSGRLNPRVKMFIDVEVETDRWWWGAPPNHEYSYDTFFVAEGDYFGPEKDPGVFLFQLLDIVTQDSILISFDSSLVVVGEPISKPSQHEYVEVSDIEACLRTRTYDAGRDYCIRVIQ